MAEANTTWFLGAVNPKKVVHRAGCAHCRTTYNWAEGMTVQQLATELVNSGAWRWHKACGLCNGELDDAIRAFKNGALA